MHGYRPGFTVLDAADPPSDPATDLAQGASPASTTATAGRCCAAPALLSQTIECLLDCCEQSGGSGGAGARPGRQARPDRRDSHGAKGAGAGQGGADGAKGADRCAGSGGAQAWKTGSPGSRRSAGRTPGQMTVSQLQTVVMNAGHPERAQRSTGSRSDSPAPVKVGPIDPIHVFQVDAPNAAFPGGAKLGYACRCPVLGDVVPVRRRSTPPG